MPVAAMSRAGGHPTRGPPAPARQRRQRHELRRGSHAVQADRPRCVSTAPRAADDPGRRAACRRCHAGTARLNSAGPRRRSPGGRHTRRQAARTRCPSAGEPAASPFALRPGAGGPPRDSPGSLRGRTEGGREEPATEPDRELALRAFRTFCSGHPPDQRPRVPAPPGSVGHRQAARGHSPPHSRPVLLRHRVVHPGKRLYQRHPARPSEGVPHRHEARRQGRRTCHGPRWQRPLRRLPAAGDPGQRRQYARPAGHVREGGRPVAARLSPVPGTPQGTGAPMGRLGEGHVCVRGRTCRQGRRPLADEDAVPAASRRPPGDRRRLLRYAGGRWPPVDPLHCQRHGPACNAATGRPRFPHAADVSPHEQGALYRRGRGPPAGDGADRGRPALRRRGVATGGRRHRQRPTAGGEGHRP